MTTRLTLMAAGLGFILFSCAPKTTEAVTAEPVENTESGGNMIMNDDLSQGERIFQNDCTRCHGAKPIDSHTKQQWTNILNRMTKKAQLDETDAALVTAYVMSHFEE